MFYFQFAVLQFIYVLVLDTEEGIVVQQAGYEDTEVM